MYLNFLFNLAYFFIGATILFVIVAKWPLLVRCWEIAKIKGQNKKDKIDFVRSQEAKGLKPFSFDKGNTIIYAKNGNVALADYKRLKDESKDVRKILKQAK